jgi:hypothetical protein
MPAVKNVGEPYEGEPHVRFDGGELETETGAMDTGQERPLETIGGSPAHA